MLGFLEGPRHSIEAGIWTAELELPAFRSRVEPDLEGVRQEGWAKASLLQIDEVSGPRGEGLGLGSIDDAVGTAAFSEEARRAMSSPHSPRGLIQ